jgi:hypothetical protein
MESLRSYVRNSIFFAPSVRICTKSAGCFGAGAGSDAAIAAEPGEINRLVALGGLRGNRPTEKINVPLLVIITREDANAAGFRLPGIQTDFDKVPAKKRLLILEGSAHAQFMFDTPQSGEIIAIIVKFLSKGK